MTYCPECGSEVAPENTFCAYCGIALTPLVPPPAAPPAEEEKASPAEAGAAPSDAPSQQQPAFDEKSSSFAPAREMGAPQSTSGAEEEEELPPTIREYEQAPPAPEVDWGAPVSKPQTGNVAHQKTSDSYTVKTEPVEVPPFDFEGQKGGVVAPPPSPFSAGPAAPPPTAGNIAVGDPQPANLGWDDDFSAGGKGTGFDPPSADPPPPPVFDEPKPIEKVWDEKKAEYSGMLPDQDFQSTIPYTPRDYVNQELVAAKTSGEEPKSNKPEFNFAAEPERKPAAPAAPPPAQTPIMKPDAPVGSSQHESLEPKLVSVQIFDPAEPNKADDSLHDSQTLLKHPPPPPPAAEQKDAGPPPPAQKQPQAEPAPQQQRSHTSPNIGGTDTDGRKKAKLKPLDEGTILNGRYEIVRKIGGGGMGAVYLASDRNLGGVLRAVKEMVQSYIEDTQQEKAVNDFKRESLLLTSLDHPAIPTIFDYFYDDKEGRFYLVMKYISGGDLAGRLRSAPEGRIDEATVTEWGAQIADVLDYLHNRQPPIVYRDLKPSNIMIDGNTGRVMLIDFGIARWVNKEEKGVTAVGTMGYAPPELFSGNVEPRSDIYSLGSTMFHLLTGADPQSNPLLIFDFHKNPRPRQINSLLSDQIEQILMRMVEYNADKRFSGAAELRDTLAKHLENLRKGAVTFGANEAAALSPAMGAAAPGGLVFCGFCGQKIVATDVFCPFCGAQQPLAAAAAGHPAKPLQPPPFAAPRLTARLMVVSTNDLEKPIFNLEKDSNLVGRRDPLSNIFPEVDLSKFDPQTKISRRHARIWRESDTFMIEDLGSSNGTILITRTNEPLRLGKNQPHVLAHGDKLRLGDTTLHFVVS